MMLRNSNRESAKSLPLRFGRLLESDPNVALIKVSMLQLEMCQKKQKRGPNYQCFISCFGIQCLVIFGIVRYRYHVWACKKESNHGNNVLSEDALYDHLLTQNLRK